MKKESKKVGKLNNKGFSLVELIIVIAIMAVLAGALAPQFIKYIDKSRKAADVQSGQTIAAAVNVALANEEAFKDATSTLISDALTDASPDDFQKELQSILGKKVPKPKYKASSYTDFYIVIGSDKVEVYASGSTVPATLDPDDMLYPIVGDHYK